MKTVKRFDNHKIGKNVVETPQGFLIIPALTARTGIQFYKDENGKLLREMRPDEEVFSESSMSSLRTAVVTDGHPKEMVSPDNARELMVGHTNGIVSKKNIDGEKESFLGTDLIITHRDAIEAIKAGKAELSNGYKVDLDFTSGEHNGQKFDAIQRNIVNNHIAIVWRGRAGNKVRLKLDRNDAILLDESEINNPSKGETMKIKINEKEFDVADELGQAITDERAETEKTNTDNFELFKKKANKEEDEKKKKLEKDKLALEAKNDSLVSDLEKLKKEKTDGAPVNVDAAVKARISVINVGKKMLDGETVKKLDDMSNEEIKIAVIKVDSPKVEDTKLEKTDYVDARFDHISENLDESKTQTDEIGKDVVKNRKDGNGKDEYKTPDQVRTDAMKTTVEDLEKPVGRSL